MEKIEEFVKIGSGYGDGSGDGDGLNSLNNQKIYLIDGLQTIIKSVKGNIARGFIVQSDLTLTPCFISKGENFFAHGKTLKEALDFLNIKLIENLSIDERIEKFNNHFKNKTEKYKAIDFYDWHHVLTGSCDLGRKSFVKDRNIDLDNDFFTVDEFIYLVENNYGSDIIKKLKESI